MVKEAPKNSFYAFRLQARLIPTRSLFIQNVFRNWGTAEVHLVGAGFGARQATLTVDTWGESTAAAWDVQVKLTWDKFGRNWVHEFRIRNAVPFKC